MKLRRLPHKSVLVIAWPMVLSNISVPLLGIVDTAILGHLPSPHYLSAVALGASLLSIIFWAMGFLRMGTTSLVARAFGGGDTDTVDQLLIRSGLLAVLLGLALILVHEPLLAMALAWMGPSADTAPLAASYSQIRILSAPLVLLNLVIIGWFIGRQNTRIPLLIMVVTNLVNLLLDMLFIWGLGLNSDGAALATVCADGTGLLLGGACVLRVRPQLPALIRQHLSPRWCDYQPLLTINRHLFVRTLCLLVTIAFFTAQGARLGDSVLAANAIIFQLLLLTSHALDGFAFAAEALVGKAVGERNRSRLASVVAATGLWSLAIALSMTLLYAVSRPWLIPFFTDIASVADTLQLYYGWVVVLPLLFVGGFWLDGVFIGAGETRLMQYAMLACCGLVFFPLWWLTRDWHNHGLWLAFVAFGLARGLSLGLLLPRLLRT